MSITIPRHYDPRISATFWIEEREHDCWYACQQEDMEPRQRVEFGPVVCPGFAMLVAREAAREWERSARILVEDMLRQLKENASRTVKPTGGTQWE